MANISHFLSVFLVITFRFVSGYVPASPTNVTTAIQAAMNLTSPSLLHLQWYSNGSYWENVSYQLVAANSTGISQGALVHFSEVNVTNATLPSFTPWIALVSCDYNATNASQEVDIFTLARDKGAVSALLYSLYSEACIINPEYTDPAVFDQVLDIFTTESLTAAHIIEYQYGQSGISNNSVYDYYDSQLLNQSFANVNESIATGNPVSQGYLIATLQAYNATVNTTANSNANQETPSNNGNSNTGLAMIILYAITGCVSALFCVVIISGAIRAIRHPERYGPRVAVRRGGGAGTAGQSRARGLTRAILDTFPVVKFATSDPEEPPKDAEETLAPMPNPPSAVGMELSQLEGQDDDETAPRSSRDGRSIPRTTTVVGVTEVGGDVPLGNEGEKKNANDGQVPQLQSDGSGEESVVEEQRQPVAAAPILRVGTDVGEGPSYPSPSVTKEIVPDAIGRETCPICIVDFEEGDDLRLLPCEGKHRFHQQCVDPWLLELSSSCPICRQDFLALEAMLSGESEEDGQWLPTDSRRMSSHNSQGNRFSRYLKYARRRNREREGPDTSNPDPET